MIGLGGGVESVLRLAASAPAPVLDLLFGKPEPMPDGYDPKRLQPASYPPGYGEHR